jgi:Zn-dependent peptidase ImmA (M78 family)
MATVLSQLRDLCPPRRLAPYESRRIAEQQASRLLTLMRVADAPVPEQIIEYFPRTRVEYINARTLSGAAQWRRGWWIILVNRTDTWGRQRFSLAHEFKHVIDAPLADTLYRSSDPAARTALAERAADTFAASLLMPRVLMKRAFYDDGIRDTRQLARSFQVSAAAMRIRVEQLQLIEPAEVST